MKSGNLNFLEPSGPLQAYNGTDLSFFPPFFHERRSAHQSHGFVTCDLLCIVSYMFVLTARDRLRLKCDGTCAETRFRLSANRTSAFKLAVRQFSRLLAAEVCASAGVMLDTPCSVVV